VNRSACICESNLFVNPSVCICKLNIFVNCSVRLCESVCLHLRVSLCVFAIIETDLTP